MPSPFPGMDPYLESPLVWKGLHTRLLVRICDQLQPQLVPEFVARTEERVILNPLPDYFWPDVHIREQQEPGGKNSAATLVRDAEVTVPDEIEVPELTLPHRYIEIRDPKTRRVVTIIEVLSPWNKTGEGLADYRMKQREILVSGTHLVEIDLLRGGQHAVAVPRQAVRPSDYRICTHRSGSTRFQVISFGIRDPLPVFRIPVTEAYDDVLLDLREAFTFCYDAGVYQSDADYEAQPDPSLKREDWEWSRALLREKGFLVERG